MSRELKLREVKLVLLSSHTPHDERAYRNAGERVYEGTMVLGPKIGYSFTLYRKDAAYMHTSTVKSIQYVADDKVILHTLNSVYELTLGKWIVEQ